MVLEAAYGVGSLFRSPPYRTGITRPGASPPRRRCSWYRCSRVDILRGRLTKRTARPVPVVAGRCSSRTLQRPLPTSRWANKSEDVLEISAKFSPAGGIGVSPLGEPLQVEPDRRCGAC
jgi:hypothetical protein